MSKIIYLLCLVIAAGCYKTGPDEEGLHTVPVTNNPHLLPGPARSSPLPMLDK